MHVPQVGILRRLSLPCALQSACGCMNQQSHQMLQHSSGKASAERAELSLEVQCFVYTAVFASGIAVLALRCQL